jgi:hypothetical protein
VTSPEARDRSHPWTERLGSGSILHVTAARQTGPTSLRVRFNDGVTKEVDLSSLLRGPLRELRGDSTRFERFRLDRRLGVLTWPPDLELAPEALYFLPDVTPDAGDCRSAASRTKSKVIGRPGSGKERRRVGSGRRR